MKSLHKQNVKIRVRKIRFDDRKDTVCYRHLLLRTDKLNQMTFKYAQEQEHKAVT